MRKYELLQAEMIRSFANAADDYYSLSSIQQHAAEQVLDRLSLCKIEPKIIVDVGCGSGELTNKLAQRYPQAKVIGVDITPSMIEMAKMRYPELEFHCADAHQMPFETSSIDMICSNMMLHWSNALTQVFQECRRILSPEGVMLFSLMGTDSLQELRYCWAQIDDAAHVNAFPDMHNVGDAMLQAQFADPVMDREVVHLLYPDVMSLMQHLKAMGVQNVNAGRRQTLLGKSRLAQLQADYQQHFSQAGKLVASFEIIYGHAWGNGVSQRQRVDSDGGVRVPLKNLKRRADG